MLKSIRQLVFICIAIISFQSQLFCDVKILILPFWDKSGLKHERWDISREIPGFYADSLGSLYAVKKPKEVADYLLLNQFSVSDFQKAEVLTRLARDFDVNIIVYGQIDKFQIGRLNIGTAIISGYAAYQAQIKVSYRIFDRKAGASSEERICENSTRQKEFINFAAKPGEQINYSQLDSLDFASPEFMRTVLGGVLLETRNQLVSQVINAYPLPEEIRSATEVYFEGRVLVVRQNEVYINVGRAEGIVAGEIFSVYSKDEELKDPETKRILGYSEKKVGKIKVLFIKDNHLSHAAILEGAGKIKPDDIIRIRKR
ncbi:hypothetical protein JXJ21_16975 [candidate division KSB1 bacterium]|nr:hypothetical protein [candidate division KSB1 bacterium]